MSADTILAPIMTFFGLVVCFGSTYFKKICSALTGFVWGTLVAAISQLIAGGLFDVNDDFVLISLGVGVVCAIVLYMFDSLAGAINAFFIVALLALLFGMVYLESYFDSFEGLGIFAVVAGMIAGAIAFIFDKYAFAISTAITGATFSGLGGICLIHNISLSDAVGSIFYGGNDIFSSLPIYVIILGSMGTAFQLYVLSIIKKRVSESSNAKVDYSVLVDLIKNNILVIAAPCIATLIPHFVGWISNYGSEVKTYGDFIYFLEDITVALMIGCAIYLFSKNKIKSAVLMLVLYDCLHVLVNYYNYFVSEYRWSISPTTFKGIGTAVVLLLFNLVLKNRDIKFATLPFVGYISFEYLMNWIAGREVFAVGVNLSYFIMLIVTYLTVMALYYNDSKEIMKCTPFCRVQH